MSGVLWFLLGAITGLGIFYMYSWLTDKINLLKIGYNGGSFVLRWFYNRFIKKC